MHQRHPKNVGLIQLKRPWTSFYFADKIKTRPVFNGFKIAHQTDWVLKSTVKMFV
jgi:hypothetical protein